MDQASIKECLLFLKIKNSEGFDRIPQQVLLDCIDYLLEPLIYLFEAIYDQKKILNKTRKT